MAGSTSIARRAGDPACEDGHEKKQDSAGHKSRSVRGRFAEEERAQPSRGDEGGARAEEKPRPGEPHAVPQNHAQNLRAPRAQCEADANLMCASAHLKRKFQ